MQIVMEFDVKHIILLIGLFIMQGCSINQLFLTDEIDKVTIVRHTPYLKHNRAYFTRDTLKLLGHKKPYQLFLNPKTHDLGVLLHRGENYTLYHFFSPPKTSRFHGTLKKVRAMLKKQGYKALENATQGGYVVHTGPRRYKGVKTYLIDITDYSRLKKEYEKVIRTYNTQSLSSLKDTLPKSMIEPYLRYYWQRAEDETQKKALRRIEEKLHIVLEQSETPVQIPLSEQTPYHYYRYRASMYELGNYLNSTESRAALTPAQYTILQHRLQILQQEKLLEEGSLETLIAAYEKNHDPRFKQRILELLKKERAN